MALKKLNPNIIKFLVAGGSAAGVEYGSFLLFTGLFHPSLLMANSLSFMCGLVVSFLLNKKWVFRSDGGAKKQFGQYLILATINLVLGNILIWLLVFVAMPVSAAKIITMLSIASWNYLVFSKYIFKAKS